jgi:hypothetical protein
VANSGSDVVACGAVPWQATLSAAAVAAAIKFFISVLPARIYALQGGHESGHFKTASQPGCTSRRRI